MFKVPKYDYTVLRNRPEGASQVGVQDVDEYFVGNNVEAVLKELKEMIAGGTGVTDFIGLDDTPNAYTGAGGYAVRVKADVSGLEFIKDNVYTVVTDSSGDRTLALVDMCSNASEKLIRMQNGVANLVRVPLNVFPAGAKVYVVHGGAGQMTFIQNSGVTILPPPHRTKVSLGTGAVFCLLHVGGNTWHLVGETEYVDNGSVDGTAYTFVPFNASRELELGDVSTSLFPKMVFVLDGTEATVPIYAQTPFEKGCQINLLIRSGGAFQIIPADGVTIYPPPNGTLQSAGDGAVLILINLNTDEWQLVGTVLPSEGGG